MTTSKSTFQKRQKEMKRQEKQRMKAERRAQKKLEPRTGNEIGEVERFDTGYPLESETEIPEVEPRS